MFLYQIVEVLKRVLKVLKLQAIKANKTKSIVNIRI
jgi:hypothetical protein